MNIENRHRHAILLSQAGRRHGGRTLLRARVAASRASCDDHNGELLFPGREISRRAQDREKRSRTGERRLGKRDGRSRYAREAREDIRGGEPRHHSDPLPPRSHPSPRRLERGAGRAEDRRHLPRRGGGQCALPDLQEGARPPGRKTRCAYRGFRTGTRLRGTLFPRPLRDPAERYRL